MSPITQLHEEVLGPIEDLEEEELPEEEEEPLSQDMVLMAVSKLRQLMEEKLEKVVDSFSKKLEKLTFDLEESQQEVKMLRELHSQHKKLELDVQNKSLEDSHSTRVKLSFLEKSFSSQLKSLRQELLDSSAGHAKATERWLNKRLESLSGLQGDHLESLHKMFEMGVGAAEERFKSLLASLPTPQVHFAVPEGAIKMEQLPSQVTVNVPQQAAPLVKSEFIVPDQAFKFHVEQPPAQVILPEKALHVQVTQAAAPPVIISEKAFEVKAPEVHVNVPEQEAPSITVNTPRRKVIKHIEYDEQSRPKHIVEEEILESEDSN